MLGGKGAANATFSHKSKKPKLNIEEELKGNSIISVLISDVGMKGGPVRPVGQNEMRSPMGIFL